MSDDQLIERRIKTLTTYSSKSKNHENRVYIALETLKGLSMCINEPVLLKSVQDSNLVWNNIYFPV